MKHASRALEGPAHLSRIVFEGAAAAFACDALFFNMERRQRSDLPAQLGCSFESANAVRCRTHTALDTPGLYVAATCAEAFIWSSRPPQKGPGPPSRSTRRFSMRS